MKGELKHCNNQRNFSSLVFKLPTNYLTILSSEINHSLKNFHQLNHLKKKKGGTDLKRIWNLGLALPILGIIRLFNKIGKIRMHPNLETLFCKSQFRY